MSRLPSNPLDLSMSSAPSDDIESFLEPLDEAPTSVPGDTQGPDDIEQMLEPAEPPQMVQFGNQSVPMSRVEEVAARMKTTPDAIIRSGSSAGKFEARLAKSPLGQAALRLEQGFSDTAVAGLDLLSRSGVLPSIDTHKLQKEQKERAAYLDFIEQGGDIQELIGERGSRIFNSVVRSTGNVASSAPLGGSGVLYASMGAQSFDRALNDAEQQGMAGTDAVAYAAKYGAAETAVTFLFGQAGARLGLRSLEEGLSPGMRAAAARYVDKKGVASKVKEYIAGLPKPAVAALGAVSEAAEESIVDAIQQNIDITDGLQKDYNWGQTMEAGLAGAIGSAGVELGNSLNGSVKPKEIETISRAVTDAESIVASTPKEQLADLAVMTDEELQEHLAPQLSTVDAGQHKAYTNEFRAEIERAQTVEAEEDIINEPDEAPITNEVEARAATAAAVGKDPVTARNVDLQRDAEAMGMDGYYSPEHSSQVEWQQEAIKLKVPENAISLSTRVLNKLGKLDVVEQEGLKIRLAQLNKDYETINTKLAAAKNQEEIAQYGDELNRTRDEHALIKKAVNIGGTDAAQLLVNRRMGISDDYTPLGLVASGTAAKKDKLTGKEKKEFEKLGREEGKLDAEHQKADDAMRDRVAFTSLVRANEQFSDQINLDELYTEITAKFEGGCDIG